MLAGGGMHVKKIPLGVTVRKIVFLDESAISTNHHPVYALIVSMDEEVDNSAMDDDGLTMQERDEKKIQEANHRLDRLVDADLKGHEHDFHEWVETIDREDFLDNKKELGLTPPGVRTKYQVWLMDAADWTVFQKIPMAEDDVAQCISVVRLTEDEDDLQKKAREVSERALKSNLIQSNPNY
jgi:hypothetical protein